MISKCTATIQTRSGLLDGRGLIASNKWLIVQTMQVPLHCKGVNIGVEKFPRQKKHLALLYMDILILCQRP